MGNDASFFTSYSSQHDREEQESNGQHQLFQNLRCTRETELAEQFPLNGVTAWIGNSERVAARHYLQLTDAHLRHAVGEPTAQNAAQEAG
jgi:hypothetical protein